MSNGMPEASSVPQIVSTDVWPDSLHDALGQVIADLRRQWRLEYELMGAQAQATIEQLRSAVVVANATISELRAAATTRLAELHDGAPGAAGEQGPPGPKGESGELAMVPSDLAEQIKSAIHLLHESPPIVKCDDQPVPKWPTRARVARIERDDEGNFVPIYDETQP